MWYCRKNMMELERPQMTIWRRAACWISKITRAPSTRRRIHKHKRTHSPKHTQKYLKLIALHSNNGFVTTPHCYVIRTLPVLLTQNAVHIKCLISRIFYACV
jgi:hypothetical protein